MYLLAIWVSSLKEYLFLSFAHYNLDFFFCSIGVLTQGLMISRWVLYHLSHTPSPFCCGYFFEMGSCIYALANLNCDPPTYVSCTGGVAGTPHHAYLLFVDMVSPEFFLPETVILPISACCKAGITGVSHYTKLILSFENSLCILNKSILLDICHTILFFQPMH
jgi:hypothetical protein